MMSLTIRRRILLSFALVLAVMSGMAALSYAWFTQAEREAIRVETDTVPGLYLSAQLMTTWGEGRGLAREFLLSDTSAEKGDAAAAIAANRDRMHEILKSYDATIMSEEDRRNYAQAVRLFDEFVAAQQPVVAAGRVVGAQGWTPERIAAARLGRGIPAASSDRARRTRFTSATSWTLPSPPRMPRSRSAESCASVQPARSANSAGVRRVIARQLGDAPLQPSSRTASDALLSRLASGLSTVGLPAA